MEPLIRNCLPIPQKIYNITKRLKTPQEVEKYFPGFLTFIDFTEQQIFRPVDKRKKKKKKKAYYSVKKKRHAVKNQIMVINHKANYKKERDMIMIFIKRIPITPKNIVNVIDLAYLGVEKDIPEQL